MGYCVNMEECNVLIKEKDLEVIVKELQDWASKQSRISWADIDSIMESDSVSDIMDELRWEVEFDESYNIIDFSFDGEKLGSEFDIFEIVLKYSKEGSYVTMYGEDGDKWRYQYVGSEFKEVRPNF